MTQQRLLAIDLSELTVYRWRSGQLFVDQVFAADATGLSAWAAYLQRNRNCVYSVLPLVAEESFRCEDCPPARGADRQALLARRQAQYFPGKELQLTLSLQRLREGRRDENVLFAALSRPESLDPWLAPLLQVQARLAGVYTVPLLAERIALEVAGTAPRVLLVALLGCGMQQMLFEGKRLRYSRCTLTPVADVTTLARTCAEEAARVEQYLRSQRLLGDVALNVVVLLHLDQTEVFRTACLDNAQLRYQFADLTGVARKHALRSLPEDSRSDALFLHLMVRRPAAAQYAPPAWRRHYQLGRVRQALNCAALAIALLGLLLASDNAQLGRRLDDDNAQWNLRIAALRARQQTALAALPARPVPIEVLREVLAVYERADRHAASMESALRQISAALDAHAAVAIDRLAWSRGSEDAGSAAGVARTELQARLPRRFAADTAAQRASVERFRASLGGAPGYGVEVLRWPAALDASRSLSDAQEQLLLGEAPRFTLSLVQR